MTLKNLELNAPAKILNINCNNQIKKRFIDLGFIKGSSIIPVLTSPSGNIRAYYIKDTLLALRDNETQNITVEKMP